MEFQQGPEFVTTSVGDIFTPAANTYALVHHIHIANTNAAARTISLWIGDVELAGELTVRAKDVLDLHFQDGVYMTAADTLTGQASDDDTSLVVTVMGLRGVLAVTVAPEPFEGLSFEGLVGWWRFNAEQGLTFDSWRDSDLTNVDSVTSGTGILDEGAVFDGGTQHLSVATNPDLEYSGISLTRVLWINPASATASYVWSKCNFGSSNSSGFAINTDGDLKIDFHAMGYNPSTSTLKSDDALTEDDWNLVICWYDADLETLNIQINNGTVKSASMTDPMSSTSDAMMFANDAGNGSFEFDGQLDEGILLHDRVLTTDERTALYNAGAGMQDPFGAEVVGKATGTSTTSISDANVRTRDGDLLVVLTIHDNATAYGAFTADVTYGGVSSGNFVEAQVGSPYIGISFFQINADTVDDVVFATGTSSDRMGFVAIRIAGLANRLSTAANGDAGASGDFDSGSIAVGADSVSVGFIGLLSTVGDADFNYATLIDGFSRTRTVRPDSQLSLTTCIKRHSTGETVSVAGDGSVDIIYDAAWTAAIFNFD